MAESIIIGLFVIIGLLAYWYYKGGTGKSSCGTYPLSLTKEYFVGLNYLLNDETDEAIDTFIRALRLNSETVETHLALGALQRRRGKVDKAIQAHLNLLARPDLSQKYVSSIQQELAKDYIAAGLLDRAERLLKDIVGNNDIASSNALLLLMEVYQQEQDWNLAIDVATKLLKTGAFKSRPQVLRVTAHYYCELSDQLINEGNLLKARKQLKVALSFDMSCVRASLMLGKVESQLGAYKESIKAFKKVKQQDAEFVSETIQALAHCYKQLGKEQDFVNYLKQSLDDSVSPSSSLLLAYVDCLSKREGHAMALSFMTNELKKNPSIRGIKHLIDLHIEDNEENISDNLQLIKQVMQQLVDSKPIYKCLNCGFGGKQLHWQCPGCKVWGEFKPVHGLEGD